MKNISFLVSANKTIIFKDVADKLESDGYSSYWITPSQNWYKWLLNQGISEDRILNLSDEASDLDKGVLSSAEIDRISTIESEVNLSFRDMYFMDRVLREKDYHYALRYMLKCFDKVSDFAVQNDICKVFSEQTWNFEIITSAVCTTLNIDSYYVDGVKVPDGEGVGRFAFFRGSLLDKMPKSSKPKREDFEFAKKFLEEYRCNKQGTSYLTSFFYKPSIKFSWAGKFFKHLKYLFSDRFDLTRRPLLSLIRYRIIQVFNYSVLSVVRPFSSAKSIKSKRYILIVLHKQPDSAVDVAASNFLNQFEAVKAFARKIPIDYDIVIKDHSHALGLNSLSKYKVLSQIPRVTLVEPKSDIFELIDSAKLVYSLGGTASLEAAIMGRRSLTAVEKFFSDITMRRYLNPYHVTNNELLRILGESPPSDEQVIEYLATVHANSYVGMVLDPTSNSMYGSDENINNIYLGFKSFLLENCND